MPHDYYYFSLFFPPATFLKKSSPPDFVAYTCKLTHGTLKLGAEGLLWVPGSLGYRVRLSEKNKAKSL